jgi:hypothetical protein
MIKKGQSISLSEQFLVDCDNLNHGCQGGGMFRAYKYIQDIGGIPSTANYYPYTDQQNSCNLMAQRSVKIADFSMILNVILVF